MEWQPIETAPKDVKVLVCSNFGVEIAWFGVDPNNDEEIAEWLTGSGDDFSCGYYFTPCNPTHWTPLPKPPVL